LDSRYNTDSETTAILFSGKSPMPRSLYASQRAKIFQLPLLGTLFILCLPFIPALSQSPEVSPAPTVSEPTVSEPTVSEPTVSEPTLPRKHNSQHLPNLIQVTPNVFSGGLPEGPEAFQELKSLGIKTILSVDGAKPDLKAADLVSMQYVHIPHGYDGIPQKTIEQLAKAISELPGPIYIHCHHGKHRSPAATAAACKASGQIDPTQAERVLQLAGTNPKYKGLVRSVKDTTLIPSEYLATIPANFPSTAQTPPLVDAMVELEHSFIKLQQLADSQWQLFTPIESSHPTTDFPHESVLLREHFEEMLRLGSNNAQPSDYQAMLSDSHQAAWRIEQMLHQPNHPRFSETHVQALRNNWNTIQSKCIECHQAYRDNR
jgi:protein tyrosine phosphatase (PTP) superfamily phosphohydrolase (DUF442 family)